MNKIKKILLTVCFLLPQCILAHESPLPMLESSANQIIATLKENKANLKNNPKIIHAAVRAHLLPIVDVTGMSRSVLGRQAWNKATPAERSEFEDKFTQLVIRTYSGPLAEYTDEKIRFLPLRDTGTERFARVKSIIVRSNGQNIPLNYSLVSINGKWKIYDLSVEGVSLLQSFHNQFSQVLQNASMRELIAQMSKKNKAA